jgi:hypothetical protein
MKDKARSFVDGENLSEEVSTFKSRTEVLLLTLVAITRRITSTTCKGKFVLLCHEDAGR